MDYIEFVQEHKMDIIQIVRRCNTKRGAARVIAKQFSIPFLMAMQVLEMPYSTLRGVNFADIVGIR